MPPNLPSAAGFAGPTERDAGEEPARFPTILSETADASGLVLDLGISDTLVYFPGHFPQSPILPGVVQIHWAIAFGRAHFSIEGTFRRLDTVKFKDIIRPLRPLRLHLCYHSEVRRLHFAYRDAVHEFSSGRIYFA